MEKTLNLFQNSYFPLPQSPCQSHEEIFLDSCENLGGVREEDEVGMGWVGLLKENAKKI